jgi:hypothetical protein
MLSVERVTRARISKRLWSLGIEFKESIPPVYGARRAGTIKILHIPTRFLAPIECLQIRDLPSFDFYGRTRKDKRRISAIAEDY